MSRVTNSRNYPHVTAILAQAGLVEKGWFKDYDLSRGSALHKAAQYLDEGTLDWESVDGVILGRLAAYQRFKDEVQPVILAIEEPVVNEDYRYCGTLDRRLVIGGREGVLDIKGPSRAAWQALQVCLYAYTFPRPMARWTLHLSDEEYRLIEHKDRNDWNVARAAITLAAWRKANGL